MSHQTDRDFVERAATRLLDFHGFVSTEGSCDRCGKVPDGTGCLHAVYDPQRDELLEYGVYCFPTYLVPALRRAIASERDSARRQMMEANLARIPRERRANRCNITKKARPDSQRDCPAPADDCIGGGYDFIVQAVGRKTCTVQVYDDKLPLLGAALLRDGGKSEDEIAAMEESQLIRVAQALCGKFLSKTQDKQNCRILRFAIGRLTNRNHAQADQAVEELPPEFEDLLDEIE
jgi:hypothetical protein